ncbi:MAG: hypothetical protein ACT4PO_08760, partial [Actinomycetota bacterium]
AQEIIGSGLLPTLTDLLNKGSAWLDQQADSGELQRKVNEAVEAGTEAVKGITSALRVVRAAGKPVVDALGGIENAARVAAFLWVAWKVKTVAAFIATTAASAATRTKMIVDAIAAGRAWDIATRPRIMPVTVVGGGASPGPGGGVGKGPGKGPGRIPFVPIGFNLPTLTTAAVIASGGGGTKRGDRSVQYPLTWDAFLRASQGAATPFERAVLREELGGYSLANAPDASMRSAERRLRAGVAVPAAPGEGRLGGPGGAGSAGVRGGRGDGRPRPRRRTLTDIELDIARAGSTPGRADDLARYRELRDYYQRQIAALEGRKNLTDKQKQELQQLYQSLASAQSQIDSAIEEGERKLEEQRQKAREKRKRQRQRELRQREAFEEAYQKTYEKYGPPSGVLRKPRRATAADREFLRGGAGSNEEPRLTKAEARQVFDEWLRGLQGVLNQFGGNLFPPGAFAGMEQAGTQSIVQTALLREVVRETRSLRSSVRHPGSRYARSELTAAFDGVAF